MLMKLMEADYLCIDIKHLFGLWEDPPFDGGAMERRAREIRGGRTPAYQRDDYEDIRRCTHRTVLCSRASNGNAGRLLPGTFTYSFY